MSSGASSKNQSILNLPDEILIEIILHLNARERTALGNTSKRLYNLVFGDKELLRNLDFSKEGRLTSLAHIQQYFSNEDTCEYVLRINISNVTCMQGGNMLNNSIGRATNLVDVNIHGTSFESIEQLVIFLKPLVNIKSLSIDWPEVRKSDLATVCDRLRTPFGRLTYLSLELSVSIANLLPVIPICQSLEELRIAANGNYEAGVFYKSWGLVGETLENLKILQLCGWEASFIDQNRLIYLLPEDQQWTNFLLVDQSCDQGLYFERDVEVCKELQDTKMMQYESISHLYPSQYSPINTYLISENLLREVLRITHEDAPETFCCFSPEPPSEDRCADSQACLLKIDDARHLLKNPEYEVSFLQFKHSIETDCDAHLVTSAFPKLTVLILAEIIKGEDKTSVPCTEKHSQRRLRKRGSMAPEQHDDPASVDSSFKMLVENTPHVKDLTICGHKYGPIGSEQWDLDALRLISRWKNLRFLRLKQIPLIDGNFLINIGKECPQLETIMLHNLGHNDGPCCWTSGLSRMLRQCRNLRIFSIYQCYPHIDNLPEVLNALSHNSNLTTVRVVIVTEAYNSGKIISSVKRLLRQCPKLTTFVLVIKLLPENAYPFLESTLQRIIAGLNRPHFQFEGPREHSPSVREDAPSSFFPYKWDWFYYP